MTPDQPQLSPKQGCTSRMYVQSLLMDNIGRYEIHSKLGSGNMGTVFKAFDPRIGRWVAVKIISMSGLTAEEETEVRRRFRQEARSAGRLSHPNIVPIYDLGEGDNFGSAYIVMEFIEGMSLEGLVSNGAVDQDTILELLSQIAEALDYAHAKQIYHRDIKPANIILTEERLLKITDFGIAKIAAESMTKTGMAIGSLAFMAPEQIKDSKSIDGRSDQYSLAVIAFQMLCGRRPFVADSDATLMHQVLNEEPPLAHIVNPKLPEAVTHVLANALAKNREVRYGNCRSFVDSLRRALPRGIPQPGETRVNPRDGLTYVWIPPGAFVLDNFIHYFDSPKTGPIAVIDRGFWIGQAPVTHEAFHRVTGQCAGTALNSGQAAIVSWDSATEYSHRIGMRLPKEREWLYMACRGTCSYSALRSVASYNLWTVELSGLLCEWVAEYENGRASSKPFTPWGHDASDVTIMGYNPLTTSFRCVSEKLYFD